MKTYENILYGFGKVFFFVGGTLGTHQGGQYGTTGNLAVNQRGFVVFGLW